MIELEKPQLIHKSFAITSVVEKNLVQNDAATGNDQWIEIEGYASRMYDMEGDYVIDAHEENVNTWGIDLKRLKNGILPILYNHDQDKAVGNVMEATYTKEGLLIKAKVYKFPNDNLTNYVYNAVKSGVIKAFSVGIIVKGFELVDQDNEEYLQLSKSECIEVSLVAVPANHEALFRMTQIKSVDGTLKNAMLISKSELKKEMSEETCNGFSCAIKKFKELEAQKEETMDIIEKNVEEVTPEAEKEAVLGVTDEAMEQLQEITNPEPEPEPSPVEDSTITEGTTVTSGESDKVVDPNDKPSDEPQEDLEPEPTPEPTVLDKVSALEGLDVAQLSEDELEKVYEVLSDIVEKIEGKVVADVVQELTTVTAPAA